MTEQRFWIPTDERVDLQRQRDTRHHDDPARPGGPADVIAGMDGNHWRAPRDFGEQARAGERDGAHRGAGGRAIGGPIGMPPPARYRDDIMPPPLELHDGEQLVGGHGYSGLSRQLKAQRRGPRNYRRSDARVREDICEALIARYDLDASEVTVEVSEGRVTLEGIVPQRWMKHGIEDVAAECRGVTDIENRIGVLHASVGVGTSGV